MITDDSGITNQDYVIIGIIERRSARTFLTSAIMITLLFVVFSVAVDFNSPVYIAAARFPGFF